MLEIILNAHEEDNILNGFPWVYSNEINSFNGNIENGDVVKVLNNKHEFICYGFLNTNSKLMVRVLSLKEEDLVDYDFFYNRLKLAISKRDSLNFIDSNCSRLVFSEADKLPGLIVDQYADVLVISISTLGMDKIKADIVKILVDLINPKGIYERSDVASREKEGLEKVKGILYGNFDTKVEVRENGIKFVVDVENGQKTGYFLDQKINRDNVKLYVKDKDVLDCFSNIGGFALHSAKYGAKNVLACDISQRAVDDITSNANLNGFKNIQTKCCDVFELLRSDEIKNKFDVIILDPPAFTKGKDTVKNAYRGYKEINTQALKNIKSGGYLMTFSCSQHMTPDLFFQMLEEASIDSNRDVEIVDFRIQSPDHPTMLLGADLYLKCVVLRVI